MLYKTTPREHWLKIIREERFDLETWKLQGIKRKDRMKIQQVKLHEEHNNYKKRCLAFKLNEVKSSLEKSTLEALKADLNNRIMKYNEEVVKIRDIELENKAKELALVTLEAAIGDAIAQKHFDDSNI